MSRRWWQTLPYKRPHPSRPWTLMLPTTLNSSCPTSHMGATTLDHDALPLKPTTYLAINPI